MHAEHKTTVEVRGYELDSFAHVNHAVYIQYLEHARWKLLADHGVTLQTLNAAKRWPVIAGLNIKYLKPSYMGDVLEVRTQTLTRGKTHFTMQQEIYRGSEKVVHAEITVVTVNETGKPDTLPDDLRQRMFGE